MDRFERDKEVNVIRHTSYPLWNAIHSPDQSSKVLIEPFPRSGINNRLTALGSKDQMIEKVGVG